MNDRLRMRNSEGGPRERAPRRALELKGFGLLDGGKIIDLMVLDLSYDGCKVRAEVPLAVGTAISFSVEGLGSAVAATVRWSRDGNLGLQFTSDEPADSQQIERSVERVELTAKLSLRRGGRQTYSARMFDLTPKCCKVEFVERPKAGETVWAKFDSLDAIEAVVRWVDGFYGGLEFVRPIYPAVFDILLQRLRV